MYQNRYEQVKSRIEMSRVYLREIEELLEGENFVFNISNADHYLYELHVLIEAYREILSKLPRKDI